MFLRGLQLAMNAFGTGGVALLKDVRSRITGSSGVPSCGCQIGPPLELSRKALFKGRPQRNHRFLKGLNLPIDALGTGRIALSKDVRSGITGFKWGWQRGLARRLALFEGRPQRNHRFFEGP